jgi:predicted unusual protein kinase regulating ubiquinone biosynthesis (AarF/ABC1/UbiB family)
VFFPYVQVAKRELALECNYTYEAAAQQRFKQLVADDAEMSRVFYVPEVIPELSSQQVLTTEWVNGVTIDKVGGASSSSSSMLAVQQAQMLRLSSQLCLLQHRQHACVVLHRIGCGK